MQKNNVNVEIEFKKHVFGWALFFVTFFWFQYVHGHVLPLY